MMLYTCILSWRHVIHCGSGSAGSPRSSDTTAEQTFKSWRHVIDHVVRVDVIANTYRVLHRSALHHELDVIASNDNGD